MIILWRQPLFLAKTIRNLQKERMKFIALKNKLLPPPAAFRMLCHRLRLAQLVKVIDSHKADGASAIEEKPIKKGRLRCAFAS